MLYIFAGRTGSGKSTISKPFAESRSLRWTSFGNIVRSEARKRGLAYEDKHVLQVLGQELVEHHTDRFCEMVLDTLRTENGIAGVLDGLRHRSIFDHLVRQVGANELRLIYIEVDETMRHERLKSNRGWSDSQCRAYDNDPTEWELDSGLRPLANCLVINNTTIQDAASQIDI